MTVSGAAKRVLQSIWASNPAALKTTPEDLGLDRAQGWPPSYEQRGTGRHPELQLFNGRFFELDSALHDIFAMGVPSWDAEVVYAPAHGVPIWVTHAGNLWQSTQATGPGTQAGVVEPADADGNPWRLF